ncbi:MAG: iron chelate uptake ABC transporter family permease subunit [Devosia sp.]
MPAPPEFWRLSRPATVLLVLGVLTIVSILAFMTLGARGSWSFIIPFRGRKLLALVLVAISVATSTVLFQTATNNRILTPSIMGFDQLYVLLQTGLVFFFGIGIITGLDPSFRFSLEIAVMVGFASLLFSWLFVWKERSLHLLVLVGIVFGTMFRSAIQFLQRMMDPNAFNVLQDSFFASFSQVDTTQLGFAYAVLALMAVIILRMLPVLDVLTLGRAHAINLGVDYKGTITILLGVISVLVGVSAALVGPVTFFGLLVASLAHALIGTSKHRFILPAAIMLGVIALVGGQTLLERVFAFDTALSIIIEFLGGIVFLYLVIRRQAR